MRTPELLETAAEFIDIAGDWNFDEAEIGDGVVEGRDLSRQLRSHAADMRVDATPAVCTQQPDLFEA